MIWKMIRKMNKFEILLISFLGVLSLTLLITLLVPSSRNWVQSHIFTGKRTVLAKVEGTFPLDSANPHLQTEITVLKIRENQDLLIEIYRTLDGEMSLWTDFRFENEKDSYLTQGEKSSNLSLTDIKNDGIFRIVIPAMDSRMNPRVHILEYDSNRGAFVLLKEEDT